ncbi:MAG: T9SS type A sorting domain-containing protein [Candidatus Kapabacteria bacterium]|nr:T9SS type A sorting domain-containing protein [Candidatus Kapabacteria bacterium]
MKSFLLAAITAAMLLLDASPLWTQGEPQLLEEIWRRQDTKLTYFTVCKQGRMVVMSKSNTFPKPTTWYLIDLKTGENVYVTNPESEFYIFANYLGDKFYVYNYIDSILREYDKDTKELIRELSNIPISEIGATFISPENEFAQFDRDRHMFLFRDLNTGIAKDSFQIAGSSQDPQSLISWGMDYTIDSRYFNFTSTWLLDNNSPNTFHIYDRQTREIIFKRATSRGSHFRYQYFNTSNKIAFAEEVQLPGDDKVYSYIRIFDPDTRTIVKNIRISEYPYLYFVPNYDDTKIIYTVSDPQQHGVTLIYDLENDRFSDFKFIIDGGTLFADTNALYTFNGLFLAAYKFDWTVGVTDATPQEANIIYPNPTNGMVSINITPEFVMGRWNVSDMQGRILKKGLIGHSNILEINISDLVSGTYYVTVIGKDKKYSHKILKL